MPIKDFPGIQRLVLGGVKSDEILALLPRGSRLVRRPACPTCHSGYVAQLPESAGKFVCLACGLEFEA